MRWTFTSNEHVLYDEQLAQFEGRSLPHDDGRGTSNLGTPLGEEPPLPNPNSSHWDPDFDVLGEMVRNQWVGLGSGEDVGPTQLERETRVPLFDGSHSSRLEVILNFLNIQARHHISNVGMDDIFRSMASTVVPKDCNTKMPGSWQEARQVVSQVELDYNTIHACARDEMLYYREYANQTDCMKCGISRYKDNTRSKTAPRKKMQYFPLTTRLLTMYRSPTLAPLMTWHAHNVSKDGIMKTPADSEAWEHVLSSWPEKTKDDRTTYLGVALDGVNPFGHNSGSHSTWPILIVLYNLPPYLSIHKNHVMLSCIVLGKKKVKDMNVYLKPLVDELNTLWTEGIPAYDISATNRPKHFQLHAIMMWTISDYLGLGVASSLQTQGHHACYICSPKKLQSRRSEFLKKMIYVGYCKYLPYGHRLRLPRLKHLFNDRIEDRPPPGRTNGDFRLRQWEHVKDKRIALDKSRMKARSIFFELPYYKDLKIAHLLDAMHVEKNVCVS